MVRLVLVIFSIQFLVLLCSYVWQLTQPLSQRSPHLTAHRDHGLRGFNGVYVVDYGDETVTLASRVNKGDSGGTNTLGATRVLPHSR
jgi:hypothetical protein